VLGVVCVAAIAYGGYLLGRSSESGADRLTPTTAKPAACSNSIAERATVATNFDDAIRSTLGVREEMEGRQPAPPPQFFTGSPVDFHVAVLRCGDLTGDGVSEMVVGLGAGAAGRIFQWAIFTPDESGRWRLAYDLEGVSTSSIEIRGNSVVTRIPTFGPNDPLCCPSGFKLNAVAFRDGGFRTVSPPKASADERYVAVSEGSVLAVGSFDTRNGSAVQALSDFGSPTSISHYPANSCNFAWADLGLEIDFLNLGGGAPCGSEGRVARINLSGAAAEQAGWRIGRDASVGMTARALRDLYPGSRQHGSELILVEAPTVFGEGTTAPIVTAYIVNGRAEAFRLFVGAAGE
jgi:hypothetical protein